MEEHSYAKYLHIDSADDQIVHKVSRRKSQDEPASTGISIHTLRRGHRFPLLVCEHHPEGEGVDQGALDQRNDMDVPVELGTAIEIIIEAG